MTVTTWHGSTLKAVQLVPVSREYVVVNGSEVNIESEVNVPMYPDVASLY